MRAELAELVETARRAGWRVERTRGGHWRFQSPAGALAFTSSTPSDWRAWRNHRAHLRRLGLHV